MDDGEDDGDDDDDDDGQNDEAQATGEGRRRLTRGSRRLLAPLPLASPPVTLGAADAPAGVIGTSTLLSPLTAHEVPHFRIACPANVRRALA